MVEAGWLSFTGGGFPSYAPYPDGLGGAYEVMELTEETLALRFDTGSDKYGAWYGEAQPQCPGLVCVKGPFLTFGLVVSDRRRIVGTPFGIICGSRSERTEPSA